jgi:HTH-type transcriptional regulator/antitoxin HigA
MKAKIIKTEAEYEAMLKRVGDLMDATPGSPDEDELRLLGLLVEHYEQEHYPIGPPTPLEAIEFFMDQNSLSKADMVQFLGSPSKVSEVLNGKRPLSKTMICKLVEGLGIPAEILLEVQPLSEVSYLPQNSENLRVAESDVSYGEKPGGSKS